MNPKTQQIPSAVLRSFLPGDVVRLIPLEDPDEYKYYKMPGKPTELVFMFADPFKKVIRDPYCVVNLWRKAPPNHDGDHGYGLSYVDRADCRTLYFNGASTCETHDYSLELVKKVPDQIGARALQAAWDILFEAQERRQHDVDFNDVTDTALWREGQRLLSDLRSYLRMRAKELATGKQYPLRMTM